MKHLNKTQTLTAFSDPARYQPSLVYEQIATKSLDVALAVCSVVAVALQIVGSSRK